MEKELKTITENLKPTTAKTYENSYKRLRVVLELKDKRKPVKRLDLNNIIEKLNTVENPNTKYSMFVVIKKLFNSESNRNDIDELDKKIREEKRDHQIAKNGNLKKELPTYKELSDAIKKETDPIKYIINFLFLKANTRNMDIAYIDIHKSVENEDDLDKDRNHIYIKDGKAIFIRNKYKTFKSYGQKKNIIGVKKFVDTIKSILGDKDKVALFATKKGTPIAVGAIGSYFKRFMMLGVKEGEIMKIVLKHIDEEGSYDQLRRVASNRGTSIGTLLKEYDITNVKNPTNVITQNQDVKQEVSVE
jgi:hypothetical protein|tara:strand:- start:403 stop:1314 length:912 start_codon:yes stop_codon:yes gene_type:complete